MRCPLSGFQRVRFADLASLVKPKYFITDLSNAVLLIWFTVLLVLVSFLTVFTFFLFFMTQVAMARLPYGKELLVRVTICFLYHVKS